ncbi:MAG TPA: NAD-dependent epimerase/dehydratase family protein [Ignavibacteria bacterium]|nr:NAD-dependent epimerase/dehydratase family protein [Ignavibacteria bacterium]
MKVLVLGGNGMAGHVISLYFSERNYDVTAFTLTPFKFLKNIVGNALDKNYMESLFRKNHYDVVINCIGLLNTDCDDKKADSVYLNSFLPHFIAEQLKDSDSKLIHMSTDCVFSGKTGNYTEKSFRDGESFYDRTKALGEVDDNKNLTFRNSIIGPDMNRDGIGLFNWFMKQNGPLQGYSKALWTGVTTLTLAKAMESAINQDLSGIYNLVNNTKISKYDLLQLFNKHMRSNKVAIEPSDKVKLDKSLINTRKDFRFKVPDYETMIIEMVKWIRDHQELYPHYFE